MESKHLFLILIFYLVSASQCLPTTAAISDPTTEPEDVTAEPEGESEPEHSTAEPESGTTEPTSEPEGETNAEPTSEPEGETNAEPTSEPEGETNAEPTSEPETEDKVETEPEKETMSESEAESSTEPSALAEGEGTAESANPEAEERPQAAEIIGPPLSMMAVLIIGLMILSIYTRRHVIARHIKRFVPGRKTVSNGRPSTPKNKVDPILVRPVDVTDIQNNIENDPKLFITDFDLEVLSNLGSFNNRPGELLRIACPALLSLFLCPFTLYLYTPLVNLFWTPEPNVPFPPDINEAIACFLAPAGLVYATSFGFAFQSALHKQSETLRRVTYELGLLDQIISMASKMVSPTLLQKMHIYKAVKAEAVFMALQIENRDQFSFKTRPIEDVRIKIWSMMDIIRNMGQGSTSAAFDLDKILADKVISHMLELNSICSDRMGVLHSRIHPLKWAFLESLGFFSFFGILLIRAESYRMELIMCVITVFSISLMCYVVSDLDSPFSGFFKIDVSVLPEVIFRAKRMYDRARLGDNRLCEYPERG